MAAIHDLLQQVTDTELRKRLEQEINRTIKNKKFGIVFEEHLPECTLLYGITIKCGSTVAKKNDKVNNIYKVVKIIDGVATCIQRSTKEVEEIAIVHLVCVAEFGEAIYPQLIPVDAVENAPNSELWHTLIEADNYHALQLLEYLYPKKVDCIYIDPPYNTGAKDWKYNNDYVDSSDVYRHSKWLSMMQKRLKLAKRILNPDNSILVCTIDEKEYLHLGCLLEEMFPEARIQMIDSIINRKGVSRKGKKGDSQKEEITQFSRVSEYIFFVMLGKASVTKGVCNMLDSQSFEAEEEIVKENVSWLSMLRRGAASRRADKPKHFYPILVDSQKATIVGVGDPLPLDQPRDTVKIPEGITAVWPMRTNGDEGRWQLKKETFEKALEKGTAKLGTYNKKEDRWAINYLNEGLIEEINKGTVIVDGRDDKGALILKRIEKKLVEPKSVWNQTSHNASEYGSTLLSEIIGEKRFDYPKSLYAVEDVIRLCTGEKKDAVVVDFFAGSGTTLHAVNLLNDEDGGNRRCIMITNNEVSVTEEEAYKEKGLQPGDEEWEKHGIAQYVTWPRTVCSIKGVNIKGESLEGTYLTNHKPMSEGFSSNCVYFRVGFLDKNEIALGRQFKELIPILWMKAGAIGKRPEINENEIPDMIILKENKFAVLVNESHFMEFEKNMEEHPEIETVFIVTDSEAGYREIISNLKVTNTYQLYRDYLDNFRINSRR